jgi:FkbM family methyltransferase
MNNTLSVLLLVFNRPKETAIVFDAIRKARPAKLFVAQDGPRPGRAEESRKCDEVRSIVSRVDWPCEVKTLYRTENLGCKKAVSEAITWFFGQVEEGIILEDDCLPDQSFFPFAAEMLARFRSDERVMQVSGFNSGGEWVARGGSSYFFSLYGSCWGWATWRRAWARYESDMKRWQDGSAQGRIRSRIGSRRQWKIKRWIYDSVAAGRKDSWAYVWEYSRLMNDGLSVVPRVNLVENIGFGSEATHTRNDDPALDVKSSALSFPLVHTDAIQADRAFDSRYFYVSSRYSRRLGRLITKAWHKLTGAIRAKIYESELRRLSRLPRRKPAMTDIFGKSFRVADPASFVAAFREIFIGRAYAFKTDAEEPRIIDCGANVGVSVLYFKKAYPRSHITAFEADPAIFEVLTRNVDHFGLTDVKLVNKAVWHRDGERLRFQPEGGDAGRVADRTESDDSIAVESVRLAPYLSQTVDMLKIDIEGTEYEVMKDIAPHLGNVRNLFVEYHSTLGQPETLDELLSIIKEAGFRYHIQGSLSKKQAPFMNATKTKCGFDNQLNIFAYRL